MKVEEEDDCVRVAEYRWSKREEKRSGLLK